MMDKIINGIVNQIRQIYDESKYEIYTESVEQGLKEPCFSNFMPVSTHRAYSWNQI